MNSIHRIGVTIASLATVATLGGALVAQGYLAAQQAAAAATAQANAISNGMVDPTAVLGPETVYVNPASSPSVIRVTQTAPPVGNPPVIHIVVPAPGGEPGDNGGSDD
jgi:hypothetical protein